MRLVMAKAISYMKPDIDPNTRLYIPFNEGVGSVAKDYSQYGNHAQLTDVEWNNEGFNGAGKFNGSSSFGDCGNPASLNLTMFTIEAETKINSYTSGEYPTIVGKGAVGGGDNAGYLIYLHSDVEIKGCITNAALSSNKITFAKPSTNIEHRLILTLDANYLKAFVDGSQHDINVTRTVNPDSSEQSLYIGKGGGQYFNGINIGIIILAITKNLAQIAADCYEVVCS